MVVSKISWFSAGVNVLRSLQADVFSINPDCGNLNRIRSVPGALLLHRRTTAIRHRRTSVRIAKQSSHPNHSKIRGSGSQEILAKKIAIETVHHESVLSKAASKNTLLH
jgi:hypothetical protein